MEPVEYLDRLHFTFCLFGLFGLRPLLVYDGLAAFRKLLFILPGLLLENADVPVLVLLKHPVEVVDKLGLSRAPFTSAFIRFIASGSIFMREQPSKGHSRLYLIGFLHQTTTGPGVSENLCSCILLGSYIKPQLWSPAFVIRRVVSYLIPTSNHNDGRFCC